MKRAYFTTNDIALFVSFVKLIVVDAMTQRHRKGINDMTRAKNNAKNRAFPIVLKTIIDDAHRDNKNFTLNDKQIRSRLRAKFNDTHIKNTSWIATSSREYDAIRCAFDVQYANARANARKRVAKKNDATSNDVATIDA